MAKAKGRNSSVRAPQRLTVENAADVLDEIQQFAADKDLVQMDLSPIVSIDTAGLQLLTVVRHDLQRSGKSIALSGAPDCVVEAARLLGVEHQLELA
jgi:ABC-type transporter Mla MlaB component